MDGKEFSGVDCGSTGRSAALRSIMAASSQRGRPCKMSGFLIPAGGNDICHLRKHDEDFIVVTMKGNNISGLEFCLKILTEDPENVDSRVQKAFAV